MIRKETEKINPNDLVLNLSEKANNFDISKYEDFILELCGDWEFQQEAIRKVIKFFLSEEYDNISDLISENFQKNEIMQEHFKDAKKIINQLQFKDKLSCTIDLATGTGKTWVMYGIAQIMLCEGVIDQVLVLCPSITIKKELIKKFEKFASRKSLKNTLPKDSKIKNPSIIDASETIKKGDICIDNIHKTYKHVSSSIETSLKNKGERTLIINDEAHHLMNLKPHLTDEERKNLKKWWQFLTNKSFKFILNSTGTPYIGNNYFKDVTYRYSLRQAIQEKFVKDINYLEKDESRNWNEKLEAIYNNHKESKTKYPKAKKHITIFVTDRISKTNDIAREIRQFLIKKGVSHQDAEKQVIPVTSSPKHKANLDILDDVDNPKNPVEWIVSVSMLTEGWDVANIFQIVPHEDRAFNSKLLISQVLGRGLRIPKEYKNFEQPQVIVYNHDAWSIKIDHLVTEVAEISKKIKSVIDKESKFNFTTYWMDFDKKIINKTTKLSKVSLPKTLGFRSKSYLREQIYKSAKTKEETIKRTKIAIKEHTIDYAINDIYNGIKLLDISHKTNFSKKATKEFIKKLALKELKKIGEKTVTEENLQRAKQSFNTLYRELTGTSRIIPIFHKPRELNTKNMEDAVISLDELKRHRAILFSEKSLKLSDKRNLEAIEEAQDEIKGKYTILCEEKNFKSPVNIVILSYSNEIEFGEILKRKENSDKIDAWIKSKDRGFYSIPYIYRPGNHSLQKFFNPDFFIKKGKNVLVVEIKSDNDTELLNKSKCRGAEKYFKELNKKQNKQKYYFYFLSPEDFTIFFENIIRKGKFEFRSKLHANLLQ